MARTSTRVEVRHKGLLHAGAALAPGQMLSGSAVMAYSSGLQIGTAFGLCRWVIDEVAAAFEVLVVGFAAACDMLRLCARHVFASLWRIFRGQQLMALYGVRCLSRCVRLPERRNRNRFLIGFSGLILASCAK